MIWDFHEPQKYILMEWETRLWVETPCWQRSNVSDLAGWGWPSNLVSVLISISEANWLHQQKKNNFGFYSRYEAAGETGSTKPDGFNKPVFQMRVQTESQNFASTEWIHVAAFCQQSRLPVVVTQWIFVLHPVVAQWVLLKPAVTNMTARSLQWPPQLLDLNPIEHVRCKRLHECVVDKPAEMMWP